MTTNKVYLYLDLDGVLANFDKAIKEYLELDTPKSLRELFQEQPELKKQLNFWKNVFKHAKEDRFFKSLELMPKALKLINILNKFHFDGIYILSAAGGMYKAEEDKIYWVNKFIKPLLNIDDIFIVNRGNQKHLARLDLEGVHLLIDDTLENIDNWLDYKKHFPVVIHYNEANLDYAEQVLQQFAIIKQS